MRYLFVGGPLDGETRAVPDGETTVHARRPIFAVHSLDAVTEPSDDGVVRYRLRGRGHVVAFCDDSKRQDSIHWVAEITGAWVTAEQYWGLGSPLPTGGKNG